MKSIRTARRSPSSLRTLTSHPRKPESELSGDGCPNTTSNHGIKSGGGSGHPFKTKRRRRTSAGTRPLPPQRNEPALQRNEARNERNEAEGFAAASGMRRNDESDDRSGDGGSSRRPAQHGEGSGWRPARCGEERAAEEGRKPSDRGPNHQRASGGTTCARCPLRLIRRQPHSAPQKHGACRSGRLLFDRVASVPATALRGRPTSRLLIDDPLPLASVPAGHTSAHRKWCQSRAATRNPR
jgi:hypothetical protein